MRHLTKNRSLAWATWRGWSIFHASEGIPDQGTHPLCGLSPLLGHVWETTQRCFSFFLSTAPPPTFLSQVRVKKTSKETRNVFLTVLEAGCPRSRCQQTQGLAQPASWFGEESFSCVLTQPKGPGSSLKPFYRKRRPIPEGSTLMSSSPPKGPTSPTITLGLGFNRRIWARAWETQTFGLWQVAPFKGPE